MSELPRIPAGNGEHPVTMVTLSANDLAASSVFYTRVFGWEFGHGTKDLAGGFGPIGPGIALRARTPKSFPGTVPFILGPRVEEMTAQVIAAGAELELGPSNVLGIHFTRFRDASRTIWGITDLKAAGGAATIPPPFGRNPKPPEGTLCVIEMYARDAAASGRFFAEVFGWGWGESAPGFTTFDPGAGITGIFQSHAPSLPGRFFVYTSNVAAKLAEIEAAGGKQTAEPKVAHGFGTFGYFQDPSGTHGGLIGP